MRAAKARPEYTPGTTGRILTSDPQISPYQSDIEFRSRGRAVLFLQDGSTSFRPDSCLPAGAVFCPLLAYRHTRKLSIDDLYEPVIRNTGRNTRRAFLSSGIEKPAIGVSLITSLRRHPLAN
jgi:hypothetical protein